MWSSDSEEDVIIIHHGQREFRERINFDFNIGFQFNERFRMSAETLQILLNAIGPTLEHNTHRNKALSAKGQIQLALHWFGNGGQYHAIGDMHGVSKSTVCRTIYSIVSAVNHTLYRDVVRWPHNVQDIVQRFHALGGIPMVCGCIDGTLINIDAPHNNEEAFVDRHGKHSINCMVVCGPDLTFYYANANWPGSVHDARVLRTSSLYEMMNAGWRPIPNGILLGDSAYPLKEWLTPPLIRDPNNVGNVRFVRYHKKTSRVVENAIGLLKEKFPCLNHLRVNPSFACKIFKCCIALCNLSHDIEEMHMDDNYYIDDNINEDEDEPAIGAENRLWTLINHFS